MLLMPRCYFYHVYADVAADAAIYAAGYIGV